MLDRVEFVDDVLSPATEFGWVVARFRVMRAVGYISLDMFSFPEQPTTILY